MTMRDDLIDMPPPSPTTFKGFLLVRGKDSVVIVMQAPVYTTPPPRKPTRLKPASAGRVSSTARFFELNPTPAWYCRNVNPCSVPAEPTYSLLLSDPRYRNTASQTNEWG